MCGIAGCVGHERATEFVTNSLEALSYRGYDSAGLAYIEDGDMAILKALGKVSNLTEQVPENNATTAIGHNRWATHGSVIIPNAHPQTNEDETISVVQNGIIENHVMQRERLKAEGFNFTSQTDTEVVPHLLDYYFQETGDPSEAFERTLKELEGAYGILACFAAEPDTIYASRVGSPLVLGVNGSEHFAASDPSVIVDQTKKAIFLEDYEIARLSQDGYTTHNLRSGLSTTRQPTILDTAYESSDLGGFPHFMLKEIHDSPDTIRNGLSGRVLPDQQLVRLGGLEEKHEQLRNTSRLIIVGCGTSYHASLIGERLIEELAGIPVEVQLASEFKYRDEPFVRDTAVVALSQSGETADTIGALEKAGKFGMLRLGVINSPGSTIDRITDAGVHCRAGKEVSVASTKAFTSQVTILAEMALALGRHNTPKTQEIMEELVALPAKVEEILADTTAIQEAAEAYANYKNFLYIGRGYEYATALEGALKLKEISYIHAEGCGAGEMKHGTLALIDEDFPTMAIATDSENYDKTASNIEEIKARSGPVIALANAGNETIQNLVDDVLYVPKTAEQLQPILNSVVLQLFAYYVAVGKGLNVDQPRNLAKSVTVE